MINDLYNYLLQFDDVIKKGDFIGKNNVVYCTETDIRYALRSYVEATNTCEKVLNEILDKVTEEFNSFLGVPESGTFLAFILNQLLYQKRHKDFKINMLRTKPKNYQINTKSVNTVLPLDENEKYILVEDDIVTGSTLINYLDSAVANNICITSVVAVFVRKNNYEQIKEQILKKFGIKLYGLIEVE